MIKKMKIQEYESNGDEDKLVLRERQSNRKDTWPKTDEEGSGVDRFSIVSDVKVS